MHDDYLANAYLELKRVEKAIREYQRILNINPNYPLAPFHVVQAYERKNDTKQARPYFSRFLQNWKQADPGVPEVKEARKALSGLLN